ncbi:Maf family nucleotide pyrophosphatase [uncultured Porphyromonas sp.]|uniref:Maf family nucleotide pyrophosphatase n=1 Tax=uncultured Porphyromonas sp. TaxID=159274 RepID=UPI002803CE5A|nr:Maf family nucleotide pyrophosphatase [uncultured Porphyromonas sp.]
MRPYRWILGSQSPRRKELLATLGHPFEIRTIEGHSEAYPDTLPLEEVPLYLSQLKAEQLLPTLQADELLITADTVVLLDGQILGKPHDLDDARRMLHRLSGRQHEVVSGVSLSTIDWQISFSSHTLVTFAPLTDSEIDHYVARYQPLDKAGAYGIQEWIGYIGVSHIEGSFYNVMGLPVHRLYRVLQDADLFS